MAKSEDLGRVGLRFATTGDERTPDYTHEHFRRELDLRFENHGLTELAVHAESLS